jgi:hypothetical protein
MRIIRALLKSYPQIKGLTQIIQEFFVVFSAIIRKPSAQSKNLLKIHLAATLRENFAAVKITTLRGSGVLQSAYDQKRRYHFS